MAKEQLTHTASRSGLTIRVYTDHVEFIQSRGCLRLSQTTRMPLREIAHIDYSDIFQVLTVETRRGQVVKLRLEDWGDEARVTTETIRKHMILPYDPFT